MPRPRGRQTVYTPELAEQICRLLAAGESLLQIGLKEGFPPESTIREWVIADREGFAAKYARARDLGLDHEADEIKAIADTPLEGIKSKTDKDGNVLVERGDMIEHRRLQVDARKWRLSKMAPKRYGDRLELAGDPNAPLLVSVADKIWESRKKRLESADKPE